MAVPLPRNDRNMGKNYCEKVTQRQSIADTSSPIASMLRSPVVIPYVINGIISHGE